MRKSNSGLVFVNFVAARKILGTLSLILVIGSIILLATRGLNLGLDFTGGTNVVLQSPKEINVAEVRHALANHDFQDAVVQHYGSDQEVSIRVAPRQDLDSKKMGDLVSSAVASEVPGLKTLQVEYIGPEVGNELRDQSGLALLIAMGMMLLYVWFRFTSKFGIAAVLALCHDVLITLGLFSLMQWQFDLTVLAAILALIGYSLNDSIVVADRIRENFLTTRESDLSIIVNNAINQTLTRTINTSLTVMLVLLALLFFGGAAMRGFSIALLFGVFVGTYSSIYVVANLLFTFRVAKEDLMPPSKEEIDDRP